MHSLIAAKQTSVIRCIRLFVKKWTVYMLYKILASVKQKTNFTDNLHPDF